MIKSVVIVLLLSFLGLHFSVHAQPSSQTGLRLGLEIPSLAANRGTFESDLGFNFGFHTATNILTFQSSSFELGFEILYRRVLRFRTNHEYVYDNWNTVDRVVVDQKFRYSFVEIVVIPQYLHSLGENSALALYLGPSIGVGGEWLTSNDLSRTTIDTLANPNPFGYGPYGEYNMANGRLPASINVGVTYFFQSFVFDIRYRYSHLITKESQIVLKNLETLDLQAGFNFYGRWVFAA